MLRPLPDLPSGVIGFEAVGEIHSDDYRDVLRPAIEAAAAEGKVDLVYVLGPEFTGYSTGAAWQDTKMGLGHLSAFERIAVVTDVEWVEHLVSGFGWMVPGDLRRFSSADQPAAIAWAAGDEAPVQDEPVEPEPEVEPQATAALEPDPIATFEPEPEPVVAVTQPWAVDAAATDAPVPEPVAADAVAPEAFTAVTEPAAAEPVPAEPEHAPEPIIAHETMTPRAPLNPGADVRPAFTTSVAPTTPAVPEQWAADPSGRHQHRWWNGQEWTEHVADNGVSGIDPLR